MTVRATRSSRRQTRLPETRKPMTRATSKVPIPVVLILLSFLCPTELSLHIAGLRLPPHRLALLVLLPFAIAKLVTSRDQRIRAFDVLFAAYGVWTIFVYAHHAGQEGFVYGGSLALEALGGYFVARAFVRTTDQLRSTMRVFIFAVLAAAFFALPETLLGQLYTHDFLHKLTGYHHPTGVETRLGLTRAYGTFDHPIHYGTFCAALFAMFWFAERRSVKRHINALIMVFATFLGLSSAPILCLGMQSGMLLWDRLTRTIKGRMSLTLAGLVGIYIGMSLLSNRTPIAFIATGMTLDPWTGFYRMQIWENGMLTVWSNPWTGIGLADWERPWWMISDTVDAFWLVTMMRQGLPAFLLLALAIILLGHNIMKRRNRHTDGQARMIAMGWMMSLIALSLVGTTVHFWNVLHTYFFFFIGLGAWIADPTRAALTSFAVNQRAPARTTDAKRNADRPEPVYGRPYAHPTMAKATPFHGRPYGIAH